MNCPMFRKFQNGCGMSSQVGLMPGLVTVTVDGEIIGPYPTGTTPDSMPPGSTAVGMPVPVPCNIPWWFYIGLAASLLIQKSGGGEEATRYSVRYPRRAA